MNYLGNAQYMAAAAFFTVAVTHLLVWFRVHREREHLLFGMTALAAGFNAMTEAMMYQSTTVDAMAEALRWYVTASGFWAIFLVVFIAAFARVGTATNVLVGLIVIAFAIAMVMNLYSPASFLYVELTGLREIVLPWGETIRLAIGVANPVRIVFELAMIAILFVVVSGSFSFWKRDQRVVAVVYGAALLAFLVCFGMHAFFVDTGRLDSPYLSTYGFLLLSGLMSYDLAGEVLRKFQLAGELQRKDQEVRAAVEKERVRIAADLHDSVTQTLFSTAAIADALPAVWNRNPEEAIAGLDDLKHLTRGALAEMRTLLLELRPTAIREKPIELLLRQLGDATAGRTRMDVDVQLKSVPDLDAATKLTLYRITQEAVHNVIKHAHANNALIRLQSNHGSIELVIEDDGTGFDVADVGENGMGLQIMRERADSIQADFQIDSTLGVGTVVRTQLRSVQ